MHTFHKQPGCVLTGAYALIRMNMVKLFGTYLGMCLLQHVCLLECMWYALSYLEAVLEVQT